jgi:hypothetical protein
VKSLISCLLAALALTLALPSAAQSKRTFTGTIIDDMCARAGHAAMRMGPTDAECTAACVSIHGAGYVLQNGKDIYTLSDQRAPEKFAGRKVRVVGTLDAKAKAIAVESIAAAD